MKATGKFVSTTKTTTATATATRTTTITVSVYKRFMLGDFMLRSMWCVTMLGNMFELNKFEFEINSTSKTGSRTPCGKIRLVKL